KVAVEAITEISRPGIVGPRAAHLIDRRRALAVGYRCVNPEAFTMTLPNSDPRPTDPNRTSAERVVDQESRRIEAEIGRTDAEHVRADAERGREAAERNRRHAETRRAQAAEELRKATEAARAAAAEQREVLREMRETLAAMERRGRGGGA